VYAIKAGPTLILQEPFFCKYTSKYPILTTLHFLRNDDQELEQTKALIKKYGIIFLQFMFPTIGHNSFIFTYMYISRAQYLRG